MKNDNQRDNNDYFKEYISTALIILLESKKFQDITITDIANKAGVSRMTYYRNYNTKEEILLKFLDTLFQEYITTLGHYEMIDVKQFAQLYFACFRKNKRFIEYLVRDDLSYLLLGRYEKYLSQIFLKVSEMIGTPSKYEIAYIAGGLYKILIQWIHDGVVESDEEMAEIFNELIRKPQI